MPNPAALGPIILMFFAGIGIPIMAAFNSDLGTRMGSPWAATVILMLTATLIGGAALIFNGIPARFSFAAPPQDYLGGFLVAFYILSITWAAPRIGVGNAVMLVLFGQILSAAAIDHFGLFGAIQSSLTPRRLAGIALMMAGVFLARRI